MNIKQLVESLVHEAFIEESQGKEPSKEQIDAAMDMLKSVIQNTKFSGKVFVAGGAVRDMIMGKDPKDIDIVVELENGGILFAEFLAKKLGVYKPGSNPVVFERFGTARVAFDGVVHKGVPLDGVDVEAVYTREEAYEPGSRKPTTKYGTIKSDVFRRDLTINSLLMDLMSGEIVDLTGQGVKDIEQGVIRTPSEPNRIFQDDPLRLLRAARFAGRYGYDVPDYMLASIKANAAGLKNISAERIREEIQKILTGANPATGIGWLYDMGLAPYAMPQLADSKEKAVAGAGVEGDLLTKLSAMLSETPIGGVRGFMKALKFPNDETAAITTIVKAKQDILAEPDNMSAVLKAGTGLHQAGLDDYLDLLMPLSSKVKELSPYFNNGPIVHWSPSELMDLLSIKPGPTIGKLVQFQKDAWYENPDISKEEMLAKIKEVV